MPPESTDKQKTINDLRAQLARLGYGPGGKRSAAGPLSADDLRRRFARGKPSASPPPAGTAMRPAGGQPLIYQRQRPAALPVHGTVSKAAPRQVGLETALDGAAICPATGGSCYLVETSAASLTDGAALNARFAHWLEPAGQGQAFLAAESGHALPATCADVVFADIETAGLSSSPLFLIGAMVWEGDGFVLRQFLARDYSEERAVIAAFLELCGPRGVLVTFNGKSFDVPFIRSRAAATGLRGQTLRLDHLDLLHVSRRTWRGTLPDCRLQTLERTICRRQRADDIPGSLIPEAYHAFVRTGNAWQMVDIMRHNLLDLITLADILTRLPDGC